MVKITEVTLASPSPLDNGNDAVVEKVHFSTSTFYSNFFSSHFLFFFSFLLRQKKMINNQ